MKGLIFELREFCLHDGPGIRFTIFMKGCPLRCTWCHNPEGLSFESEMLFKKKQCCHCGNCQKGGVCPHGARVRCGVWRTPQEVADEILKQKELLQSSQGGVTFSGGEPLAQADFVITLAQILKCEHINLAIETSGYAPLETYQRVVREMDLVFQDLKHGDQEAHKRWTGVDPTPIWRNLAWLKTTHIPFIARIPLIPCVNDSLESKRALAMRLKGATNLVRVELLPYHLMAGAKYAFTSHPFNPQFDESIPPDTNLAPFLECSLSAVVL